MSRIKNNGITMKKIIQITIVVAALLVAGFWGFSAFFGEKKTNISEFLDSNDAIKQFKVETGKKRKSSEVRISPLVKEAHQFALYLDPPPPPPKPIPPTNHGKRSEPQKPKIVNTKPVNPIVKYELLGTIVNTTRPEESRALIDLPGTGQKVIKQGQEVGHTVIEEIKDGSIIIKAGQKTEELMAKRKPVPSLIKDSPNNILKMFPELKKQTSILSALENTIKETTTPVEIKHETTSGRLTNISSRRTNTRISSTRSRTSTSSRLTAPRKITPSRNTPPKLTPEQEKEAMKELLDELGKMKNDDGTNMADIEIEEFIKNLTEFNDTSGDEKTKPDSNKPE